MNIIKKTLLLVVGLLYGSSSLFGASPAAAQKHLSVTVSISAAGFVSLEKAFQAIEPKLIAAGLQMTPHGQAHYHMTLVGFNLAIAPGTSQAQQNVLKTYIETELEKATKDALKKNLRQGPIILNFDHIQIFQTHVVAIFDEAPQSNNLNALVNNIESYFNNNIQKLITNGSITAIEKHQQILLPHVSLAKTTNNHALFGTGFPSKTKVADFRISKPDAIISVQVRNGPMPMPQQNIQAQPAPALARPAAGMGAPTPSAAPMPRGMGAPTQGAAPMRGMGSYAPAVAPASTPAAKACAQVAHHRHSNQMVTLSNMMPLYNYLQSQRRLGRGDLSIVDEMLSGQSKNHQLRMDVYNMYFAEPNREIMERAIKPQLLATGLFSEAQVNANARGNIEGRLRWVVAPHILSPHFRGQDLQVPLSELSKE